MLPTLYQEKLKQWIDILLDFNSQLESLKETSIDNSLIWQELQTTFIEDILTLTDDRLEPSVIHIWQSFQTESHRCFRLLGTDMLFLKSSKSEITRQQRLSQIKTRIDLMVNFCQNLLSSSKL